MKRKSLTGILLICILITTPPLWAADNESKSKDKWSEWIAISGYTIGAGDVLDISVWNNEALTKQVTVMPDGKIHFPLIGEVVVGGKTISLLRKELEDRISPFVPSPNLTVMVQQINSMLIYVIGKVNNPGRFVLNTNVNVLQALAMAGGLNPFAKRNDIKIFRKTNDKNIIFEFEYDKVTEGEDLKQNIELERGDVVVVP
jgi:polysaccharide export outer membrane protein